MTPTGLLDDIKVLELGTGIGLAHCGRLLVDVGATVEKHLFPDDPAEREGPFAPAADGGGVSLLATDLNAGKSVRPAAGPCGAAEIAALASRADIVLLGLPFAGDGEAIFEAMGGPAGGRVVVAFTPYGLSGPKAGHLGTDITALAAGGFLHMVGDRDRRPLRLGGHQADRSQGAAGFTGAMTALFGRSRSGEGALVDVAASETVAYMEWKADIYAQADGRPRRRGEPSQWFDLVCKDGPFCFIYENPDWPRIKALVADPALDDPDYQTRDGRLRHHAEVAAILQRWIGGMGKSEAYHKLQQAGIPVGMVADMADLAGSPHYAASGFFAEASDARLGSYRRPRPAWTVDGIRPGLSEPRS